MDESPDRNRDTPLKAKPASGPPSSMAARLKANRDRRAQMSASNRAHSKMPMLNEDSTILHADEATEREEPDSRVPSKRERSLDFYDPDSPTISEASYSDGPDEPPRKRGRLDEDAVREALVTTIGYMGHSDDPGDSAPFVIYSGDDRPQSMSSLSHHDMSALKVKLMEGGRVGSLHDPTEAATWIEKNWEKEPLASFRKRGYDGPFAQMLFLGKPALALFGSKTDEFLRESAKLLSNVSTFPVIIWPSSDKPKSVLACPEIGAEGPVGGFSYDDQPEETRMEDRVHRTRLILNVKTNDSHNTPAITVHYNYRFSDPGLETGRGSLDQTSSESKVIAFVDLRIETRSGKTQIDRSFANFGFLAHWEESIKRFELGPREFDPEVTDSEVIPKKGDEWDEDSKSYRSYNIEHIAYQPRSEARRLDVKLDMEVNLKPPPLSQISFIHRDQILIWVSDPASKAQLRGIVVSMSNYLDDIRNGGLEPRREPLELDLTNAGGGGYNITAVVPRAPYSRQAKTKRKRGAVIISPAIARIVHAIRFRAFTKLPTFPMKQLYQRNVKSKRLEQRK